MTRAEEWADKLGITEPHDENCQGDGLCREHFIEKLAEAFKKLDSGEYGAVSVLSERIPGGRFSGCVDVFVTLREDQKPNPTRVLLFERRKPGPPRDPAIEAMIKARKQEILARFNEGRA